MEEMHRSRHGEGAQSVPVLSGCRCPTLPMSPQVHQTGSSLKPVLWGFCGGFTTQARLIKSLAFGDWFKFQPLPSLEEGGWD